MKLLSLESIVSRAKERLSRPLRRSFSQFGEDVMLVALFDDSIGTYVDVGSGHPIHGSNTYAFYRRGWSGTLIDPILGNVQLSQKYRPRDRCIWAICGDSKSPSLLYEYETYELSTISNSRVAILAEQGITPVRCSEVKKIQLSDLALTATPAEPALLSVDTEGSEFSILKSNDWNRFLPPVICVEEFGEPWNSRSDVHNLLGEHRYILRYRMGLSSIYIHKASSLHRKL